MRPRLVAAVAIAAGLCGPAWSPGPALSGDAPAVKVGDTWRWERADKRTGVKDLEILRVIKSVAADRIEATENDTLKVKVPAGEFDAFKVAYKGYWNNDNNGKGGGATLTNWFAPAARTTARTEFDDGNSSTINRLVELKLQP